MSERSLKYIITNHYREINKFIKKVNKNFHPESIHQLRVRYKKLRAFLRMVSVKNECGKKINLPKKLKNAYHIAGEIRDLQLQRQRLLTITKEEIKPVKAYNKILQLNIQKLKEKFKRISLGKTIKKSTGKAKLFAGEKINTTCAGKFIRDNAAAIIAIITSGSLTDAYIHEIRKRLKDIFYTIDTFEDANKKLEFSDSAIAPNEMKYFDGLLDELGNFQDSITSLALLNADWLNLLNTEDREALISIKETFNAEKNVLKNDIENKLRNELIPKLQIFLLPVA